MAQNRFVQGNCATEIYWCSLNQKQVDKCVIFRGFWQGHSPKDMVGGRGVSNLLHSKKTDPVINK